MRKLFWLLFFVPSFAQLPDVDIFMLKVAQVDGSFEVQSLKNITERPGYDNQPSFISNHEILYTSIHEDEQSDIYRYNLDTGKRERLTYTQESEYSPTLMPNGKGFSSVRVEHDGTQRLWAFPFEGDPYMILKKVKPVGYHYWLNQKELALFILGEPHSLFLAHRNKADAVLLHPSIGRGLGKWPNSNEVVFIHNANDGKTYIKAVHPQTKKTRTITETRPGAEDFVFTPKGAILMAEGSSLYRFADGNWTQVYDLSKKGLKSITRIALSADATTLLLVAGQ